LDELARFQDDANKKREEDMKRVAEDQNRRVPVPSAASVIKQPPVTKPLPSRMAG